MALNTTEEILLIGGLSLEDFSQSAIERAILSAQSEIDFRIPPIDASDPNYSYYSRRLSTIKEAHAYLTLAKVVESIVFDEAARGQSSDALAVPGISQGPKTPEKNVQAELYAKIAQEYRDKAEALIRRCIIRIPIVKRPKPLSLDHHCKCGKRRRCSH